MIRFPRDNKSLRSSLLFGLATLAIAVVIWWLIVTGPPESVFSWQVGVLTLCVIGGMTTGLYTFWYFIQFDLIQDLRKADPNTNQVAIQLQSYYANTERDYISLEGFYSWMEVQTALGRDQVRDELNRLHALRLIQFAKDDHHRDQICADHSALYWDALK